MPTWRSEATGSSPRALARSPAERRRARGPGVRWLPFAVALALYVSFGAVAGSVAPLIPPISQDLHVSAAQMGAILGAWQLVYVETSYFVGQAINRFGLRRAIALGMLLVAASAAARGLAQDFGTFLAAVALFGVGGPALSVGVPKLVSALFSARERPTTLSLGIGAPYVGQVLVFACSNSLLVPLTGSWRGVMLLYGALVLGLTLVWWLVGPREEPGPARGATDGESAALARPGELLRLRNVTIAVSGAALLFAITHGTNNWIARMLQSHGHDAVEAGYWAAAANALSAIGVVALPRLVPAGRRRFAVIALLLVLSASVYGLAALDGLPVLVAVLAFGATRTAPTALLLLVLIDTPGVGSRHIGTVGGAFYAVAELGGFVGPLLVGALLDRFASFMPGAGALAGLALLLAAMAALLQEPRPRPRPWEAREGGR